MLGANNTAISLKAQRWLYILLGAIFSFQGVSSLLRTHKSAEWLWTSLGILLLAGAAVYFLMALSVASTRSRWAPRVRLTDHEIEFRLGFFQRTSSVQWSEVRAVSLRSYGLTLKLAESEQMIDYSTSAKISVEVRQAIREFAAQLGIEVKET